MDQRVRFVFNIFRRWKFNMSLYQHHSLRTLLPMRQNMFCSINHKKPIDLKEIRTSNKTKIPSRLSKITLLDNNGTVIGEMRRDEAKRYAEDKHMKLVLVSQTSEAENYQLMSGSQLHEERMQRRKKAQDEPSENKTLVINDRITNHDLQTRIKSVQKWLAKNIGVKITLIGASGADKKDSIVISIEDAIQGQGKLINKRTVEQNTLKFFLQPAKKK